jgi:hypothetical protein
LNLDELIFTPTMIVILAVCTRRAWNYPNTTVLSVHVNGAEIGHVVVRIENGHGMILRFEVESHQGYVLIQLHEYMVSRGVQMMTVRLSARSTNLSTYIKFWNCQGFQIYDSDPNSVFLVR